MLYIIYIYKYIYKFISQKQDVLEYLLNKKTHFYHSQTFSFVLHNLPHCRRLCKTTEIFVCIYIFILYIFCVYIYILYIFNIYIYTYILTFYALV